MKKVFALLFLILELTSSHACTCEGISLEDVALEKVNLTYIKIETKNFMERMRFFTGNNKSSEKFRHSIKVLKNYSGTYNQPFIYSINKKSKHDCGVDFKGGEELLVRYQNGNEFPVINLCNILYEKNVDEVERLLHRYREDLAQQKNEPVNWTLINKSGEYENYANISNYKKGNDLHSIWTLTNVKRQSIDFSEIYSYKSFKSKITISCTHKKYNTRSIYYFSDFNAGGDILNFINHAENEFYEWKSINKGYPLYNLMKRVCN